MHARFSTSFNEVFEFVDKVISSWPMEATGYRAGFFC
jgi:hypothetical protein